MVCQGRGVDKGDMLGDMSNAGAWVCKGRWGQSALRSSGEATCQ